MRSMILFLVGLLLGGGVYALSQSLLTPTDDAEAPNLSPMAVDTDVLLSWKIETPPGLLWARNDSVSMAT